jgi:hypothetical protein
MVCRIRLNDVLFVGVRAGKVDLLSGECLLDPRFRQRVGERQAGLSDKRSRD